ncbi:MAG: hypothetical protein HYV07_13655 [Deltaproteobacteria bacterium]|nr:hypothetical protein [Deltaproteobacteria bacterium]
MDSTDPTKGRLRRALAHAPAALLILAAFLAARHWTAGLSWPCEEDFYRDMGFAQTIMDGRYGEDPFYRDARVWYNPLVHALIALATLATKLPLELVYTRAGAYLNLIVPVTFYALGNVLFGRRAALLSLASFLFLGDHSRVSYVNNATYSPWLWPDNFAQGLFYLTMTFFVTSLGSTITTRMRFLFVTLTGASLGLSALAHAAPGTLGAIVISVIHLRRAFVLRANPRASRVEIMSLAWIGALSVLFSLPFTWYIVVSAGLRIHNWDPMTWEPEILLWNKVPELLLEQLRFRTLIGFGGLALIAAGRSRLRDPHARAVVVSWVLATLGFLTYNDITHALHDLRGETWPILVGNWHFVLYTKAAESLGFGVVGELLVVTITRRRGLDSHVRSAGAERAAVALAAILSAAAYPSYFRSRDLAGNHADASWWSSREVPALIEWIRNHTLPDDVFLSSERHSVFSVGAAGRKSVVLPTSFANPYVPHEPRASAKLEMILRLETGDGVDRLAQLFAEHGVRYVIFEPHSEEPRPFELTRIDARAAALLSPVFSFERTEGFLLGMDRRVYCSWELVGCQAAAGTVIVYRVRNP